MYYIDISQVYEIGMKRYDSMPDFEYQWVRSYSKGSNMALSRFTITSHLGTHIDSPYHFIEDGKKIKDIPLETLCGNVQIIHISDVKAISKDDLLKKNISCPRLLIKSDNTEFLKKDDPFSNVYLTADACDYLSEINVKLVGIDYFSVDRKGDKERTAHMILLKKEIVILEGIVLDVVDEGEYELYCLPLNLGELEGSPCRAILKVK